ncbi:hypothetical protein [Actinoplanes ianthinogenes]|nr:hypothetical protein [Actinoplanes ianthinogenes]
MEVRIGQVTTTVEPAAGPEPADLERLVREALQRHERDRRARSLTEEAK